MIDFSAIRILEEPTCFVADYELAIRYLSAQLTMEGIPNEVWPHFVIERGDAPITPQSAHGAMYDWVGTPFHSDLPCLLVSPVDAGTLRRLVEDAAAHDPDYHKLVGYFPGQRPNTPFGMPRVPAESRCYGAYDAERMYMGDIQLDGVGLDHSVESWFISEHDFELDGDGVHFPRRPDGLNDIPWDTLLPEEMDALSEACGFDPIEGRRTHTGLHTMPNRHGMDIPAWPIGSCLLHRL